MKKLLACLVSAFVAVTSLVVGSAPADAETPTYVTWPADHSTRFNPDANPYVVSVDYPGSGHLYAQWWYTNPSSWTPLPATGEAELSFDPDGTGQVEIMECSVPREDPTFQRGACAPTGEVSPVLGAYQSLAMDHNASGARADGTPHFVTGKVWLRPARAGNTVDLTWHLKRQENDTTDVAGGTVSVTVGDTLFTPYTIWLPETVRHGVYSFHLEGSADLPDFGVLQGRSKTYSVYVDKQPPVVTLGTAIPTVYPVSDGYLDSVHFKGESDEGGRVTLEIYDAANVLRRTVLSDI